MAVFLMLAMAGTVALAMAVSALSRGGGILTAKTVRVVIAIYAFFICLLSINYIFRFIGIEKGGSPNMPLGNIHRFAHVGYYAAPREPIIFTGSEKESGFLQERLLAGESIQLESVWPNDPDSSDILSWTIKSQIPARPLRVDDVCWNLAADAWLSDGEAVVVGWQEVTRGLKSLSIRIKRNKDGRDGIQIAQWGSSGDAAESPKGRLIDWGEWAPFDYIIRENVSLYSLIRPIINKRRMTVGLPEWREALERVAIVRMVYGDTTSRFGVIVDNQPSVTPASLPDRLVRCRIWSEKKGLRELPPLLSDKPISFRDVRPGKKISIGYTRGKSLAFKLPARARDIPKFGNIVEIDLDPSEKWPLPPNYDQKRQYLVTSSREHIPLDGYFVPTFDAQDPFFAKVEFYEKDRQVGLRINDGRTIDDVAVNEEIRLGNFRYGVKFALIRLMPAIEWTGLKAIIILVLSGIAFVFSNSSRRPEDTFRPKMDALWAVLWGGATAILSARLTLAYRVSLLPPEGAGPLVIRNVFDDSLRLALWALGIPLMLCVVDIIAGRSRGIISRWAYDVPRLSFVRRLRFRLSRSGFYVIWLTLSLGLIAFSSFARRKPALIGRANMLSYLSIVVFIAAVSKFLWHQERPGIRRKAALWLIVILILVATILKDLGLILCAVSFFCVAAEFLYMSDDPRKRRRIVPALLGLAVSVCVVAVPRIPGIPFIKSFPFPSFLETGFFRLVNFRNAEAELLLSESAERSYLTPMRRNAEQHWQMLHYAAEGIANPRGYGRSKISDIGMTYPTAMSDCAFTQILIIEHGGLAGLAFLSLLVMIGWACLKARSCLPDDVKHRTFPLTAIGTYFLFQSIYMACANLGTAIFTGQNMPFLSLHSGSDVVQGAALLALAVWLTRSGVDVDAEENEEERPLAKAFSRFFFAGSISVAVVFVAVPMRSLGRPNSPYRADFRFESPKMIEALEAHLPDPDDPNDGLKPMGLQGSRLFRQPYAVLSAIEKFAMDDLNAIPSLEEKLAPNSGLFYLERRSSDSLGQPRYAVKLNRRFYSLRSPLRDTMTWMGRIEANNGVRTPILIALGTPFSISMSLTGPAETIFLDAVRTRSQALATDKILVNKSYMTFFELVKNGENLRLYVRNNPGWNVYVEGRRLNSTDPSPSEVKPLSLIVVEKPDRIGGVLFSLVYLGPQSPIFAYTQWRNGDPVKLFPFGASFPMAYALARSGDELLGKGVFSGQKEAENSLSLTIDPVLQARTQKTLHEYAHDHPGYAVDEKNYSDTKTLAATVMDSYSGELIALPVWPSYDPGSREFSDLQERLSARDLSKIYKNGNFRNHSVGSTIKPLMLSTIAAGLYKVMDPAKLIVYHRSEPSPDKALKCPHASIANLRMAAPWDCLQPGYAQSTTANYLVKSLNYVEVFMGMIGMLMNKEDWKTASKPVPANGRSDFLYGGREYIFDLRAVPESPFALRNDIPAPRVADIDKTILFKGMKSLFDIGLSDRSGQIVRARGLTFLPAFFKPMKAAVDASSGRVSSLEYLDEVVPDPVNFNPKDFEGIRSHLITFFIGGGTCKWNNVHILEALTRIATGRRVVATIQRDEIKPMPETLPAPINAGSRWAADNLIEPLREVGERGYMSEALRGMVPSPYRAIFKTGTIDEGAESRNPRMESELLFIMIGRWEDGRGFIEGETLSAYIYMQDSKLKDGDRFYKHELARPLITEMIEYLRNKRASGK